MDRPCRSWLPAGVVERSDLDRRLADTFAEWSAKWFVRRVARPLGALRRDGPRPISADPVEVRTLDDDLALVLMSSARSTLTCAMIGAPERTEPETGADRDLVEALSQACLDDLCRRLATMIGRDADASWSALPDGVTGWSCDVALGAGIALLRLTVSDDAMIASVRRAMAPAAGGPPLGTIGDALRHQSVEVSARLGGCAIPLAEFAGLGIGDVLVLDRAATAPVDLAVDGRPLRGAPCTVTQANDALVLTLQHSLDR